MAQIELPGAGSQLTWSFTIQGSVWRCRPHPTRISSELRSVGYGRVCIPVPDQAATLLVLGQVQLYV